MLTSKLLALTHLGADWVLWILIALSIASVGIMVERIVFYVTHRVSDIDDLGRLLLDGDWQAAKSQVTDQEGMEADVVRAALANLNKGADSVEEVIAGQIARSRLDYERRLAFLGTLGNNAPFIGLFGTVLGIIRAFSDLASHPGASGAGSVMSGISDALIATAVGLFVALPAVVMFNLFQRALKSSVQRALSLGHSIVAQLKQKSVSSAVAAQASSMISTVVKPMAGA